MLLLTVVNLLPWITFGILVIFSVILIFRSTILVNQAELVVLERLGKFHSILYPGLHFVLPFIDSPRVYCWSFTAQDPHSKRLFHHQYSSYKLDLRETVYDFPRQNVITRDNVTMEISAILYFQITDPKRAIYEISDLPSSIEKLAQTKLREVIGSLDLDDTLVSRDVINEKLRDSLEGATFKWGVKINRVELQEISPPHDIRVAMEKQMRAERDRRAAILEAEGFKGAKILKAEGEKAAAILQAEAEFEAAVKLAQGKALARKLEAEAEGMFLKEIAASGIGINAGNYALAVHYMKSLGDATKGEGTRTVLMPYDSSAVLGAVASIKELYKDLESRK